MLVVDVRGVGRGDGRFGHRERGPDPSVEQRFQPLPLLLRGAELGQQLHVAGVRGRAVQGGRGDHRAAAGDLGQRCVLQVGQPGAALARAGTGSTGRPRGQRSAARPAPAAAPTDRLPAYPRSCRAVCCCEHRLGGIDVVVHEAQQPLAVLDSGGVPGEFHHRSLRVSRPSAISGATTSPIMAKPDCRP